MLRNLDKKLRVIEAAVLGDKFTRSLPVSAAWNDGRVRVPENIRDNPWLHDFLREVEAFTGIKDRHDDQIDAMAHCYNAAQMVIPQVVNNPTKPIKSGLPFG
jgi:predicted phage terminase large subunit-like protein